ncbi:uncharacterized protein BDV17DRAFT_291716 [Aspergillus undulatus]|uniref:uncharacterized protein n=1 Tax=Aspergillus undulatus TaxID=1810928 RepID=UPI003CCCEACB
MYSRALLSLTILPLASAICPGYNFAFFNTNDGWAYTSNTACSVVNSGNCANICTCGGWGCSPAGKGNCGPENGFSPPPQIANRAPESCCRNDGNKNLQEGLIGKRQAEAISETNALLDRHLEEFEQANGQDLDILRERQQVEVEEAMKREAEAAALDN